MKPYVSTLHRRGSIIAASVLTLLLVFASLGSSSVVVMAQQRKDPEKRFEDFDRNNFDPDGSTNINNKFLPLKPGTRRTPETVNVISPSSPEVVMDGV